MGNITIYFDGYCPESMLKDKQVEMRLNEDDFWESEATGLQMTVFPPFAAILRWRGKGNFRELSGKASDILTGLVMTMAHVEDGKEIFPDEENIIYDKFSLEWNLDEIYKSKEEYEEARFNPNDPVFEKQLQYLNSLKKNDFKDLFEKYHKLKEYGYETDFRSGMVFKQLNQAIYDLKLVFPFNWMSWHNGAKIINNLNYDYSSSSLLDLSMYITAIFRAERFNDGTIAMYFKNGTLDRIFDALQKQTLLLKVE